MTDHKGDLMSYGLTVVNGFCFGVGLIIAAFLMKALLHIGWCS